MGWQAELGSSVLLFFLVFGMSATVELKQLRKQISNSTALLIGVSMQFLILPFVGFVVVKVFQLPAEVGIILLVVTSSPGGSYSNWWCSLFNAELSLSVTMTAISTLLSTIMLPTNLILYTRWTYSSAVVKSLDWSALFISLAVVLSGISCGLLASKRAARNPGFHRRANFLGNLAGLSLIALSVTVSSTDHKASLWQQDARFFVGVAFPAIVGLMIATYLTTKLDLEKPERVAVAVESCYQNTGIATSVAITMFAGNEDQLATAIGVPLYYGMIEAIMLAFFCVFCWKSGWTKAPVNESFCVILFKSYEVEEQEAEEHEESIEVVLGSGDVKNNMVFSRGEDGTHVADMETLKNRQQNEDPTEDMTDRSMENAAISAVEPSSPTASSTSVDEHDGEEDVSDMIMDVEGETELRNADRRRRDQQGRLGRTISTLRARATGYLEAQTSPRLAISPVSEEEEEEEDGTGHITDRSYKTVPFASTVEVKQID